jgi:hypothetical protein
MFVIRAMAGSLSASRGSVPGRCRCVTRTTSPCTWLNYECCPGRRPLTRQELQAFFDAADDRVERAAALRCKRWLATFCGRHVVQGGLWVGAVLREAAMLDVADCAANPAAPELGRFGVRHVPLRQAAAAPGYCPAQCSESWSARASA